MSQRILSSPVFPPYCWNCTIKDWKSSKQWDSVFILLNGFCSAGNEYLPVTGGKEHSFVGSEQISEIHLNPPVSEKSITDLHTSIHLYSSSESCSLHTLLFAIFLCCFIHLRPSAVRNHIYKRVKLNSIASWIVESSTIVIVFPVTLSQRG